MDCACCSLLNWALAAIMLLYVLCRLSDTAQFYVKMSIFGAGSLLFASTLPLPMFIVRPRHYKNAL